MVNVRFFRLGFFFATLLHVALVLMLVFSVSAAGNREAAASSISESKLLMGQAYDAVLGAENFDADVSGLLVRLNDAAELLSNARMAFDVGDFGGAEGYAESASELSYVVMREAKLLENTAADARVNSSWRNLVISIVGVSVVIISSVAGYKLFKMHYYKRLSKMKPKVE